MNCIGFCEPRSTDLRSQRGETSTAPGSEAELSAPIENIVIAGAGQAGGRAAEALRARGFQGAITILGGGVIGLEAACAAARNGCRVTVIESEARLLSRAFPPLVSDLVAAKHRSHGVKFIFGATVTGTTPDGVELSNGDAIEADLVLVGIGVEPVPTVAERLGLLSQGGIAVD